MPHVLKLLITHGAEEDGEHPCKVPRLTVVWQHDDVIVVHKFDGHLQCPKAHRNQLQVEVLQQNSWVYESSRITLVQKSKPVSTFCDTYPRRKT